MQQRIYNFLICSGLPKIIRGQKHGPEVGAHHSQNKFTSKKTQKLQSTYLGARSAFWISSLFKILLRSVFVILCIGSLKARSTNNLNQQKTPHLMDKFHFEPTQNFSKYHRVQKHGPWSGSSSLRYMCEHILLYRCTPLN